jgi:iron complex transport system ATP-binding protein
MPLIEVKGASFSYGQQDIFTDINFSINSGEVLCIVGPNGCGKTTLLDCILGILKLKQGEILMADKSISDLKPHMIARHIAYVPQSHVKTFPYTIMDVVLMGRASHTGLFSSPSKDDKEIAREALMRVGLWELKGRPYTQLSGGQGQLVLLARALAQRTKVIIMDEPTAHLDFKNELTVLETIVELVKSTGISVIMATHFPNHAYYFENNNLSTAIAMMDKMTFSTVGSPSAVLSEESIKSLYNIDARIISCALANNNVIKQIIPISTLGK